MEAGLPASGTMAAQFYTRLEKSETKAVYYVTLDPPSPSPPPFNQKAFRRVVK